MLVHLQAFLDYGRDQEGYTKATLYGYRSDLTCFARWLQAEGVTELADLTRAHVERYNVAGGVAGARPRTRRRRIASIRAFCGWAVDEGLMPTDPARRIKLPVNDDPTRSAPTEAEKEALFDGCNRLRSPYRGKLASTVIAVMCYAGLRPFEAVALELSDIVFERSRLIVQRGKGGKRGDVPINPALAAHLRAWLTQRLPAPGESKLFTVSGTRSLSYQGLTRLFREVKAAAGLRDADHLTPHCLRHWFASTLRRGGKDLMAIKSLMRHESLVATQNYFKVMSSELDDAVRDLGASPRPPQPVREKHLRRRITR